MSTRTVILCPGRGAYTKASHKSLAVDHGWVARAEELRAGYGLSSLIELDRSAGWDASVILRPDNVSPLIYLHTMLDAARVREERGLEVVGVAGNSMGWYTALAVAGALSFEDGFRLVQEMATEQMEQTDGGQIVYPRIDAQWRTDPRQEERIAAALARMPGETFRSIRLGGYEVLAGTERGLQHLQQALPVVELGQSVYPFRLARHGPYHTPLQEEVRRRAARRLVGLEFRSPEITLIDGRGRRHAPWSTDPRELAEYTLGDQVTTPFDFSACVRVALREYAPALLTLPGPGNTLGGVVGQLLVAERWRGIDSRAAFEAAQAEEHPPVRSMRR